jgi:hypothetical protein
MPYIDAWLQVLRFTILAAINCSRRPRRQHQATTLDDRSCRPMRSRRSGPTCSATAPSPSWSTARREEIGIAPDALGHADLHTTKKHYIQAVGIQAHARVQEVIAARPGAATSRRTSGA